MTEDEKSDAFCLPVSFTSREESEAMSQYWFARFPQRGDIVVGDEDEYEVVAIRHESGREGPRGYPSFTVHLKKL